MDGEGRLRIGPPARRPHPRRPGHPPQRGDYIAVSITDTGSGIAPENLERIFEPFFTTKVVGRAPGSACPRCSGSPSSPAARSPWRARSAKARPSPSTSRASPPAADAGPATEPEPLAEGHGTCVLVVEDNLDVGAFAQQALSELGFSTVWVMDAQKALAEMERVPFRFEVVFSDVMMPA